MLLVVGCLGGSKIDLRRVEDFEDYEPDSRTVESVHHELIHGRDAKWRFIQRVFKGSLATSVKTRQVHRTPFVHDNSEFNLAYFDPKISVVHVPLTLSSILRPHQNEITEKVDCGTKVSSRDNSLKLCFKGKRLFELYNYGPNRVNPGGNGTDKGHYREFKFEAEDEARQDAHMLVLDRIGQGTKMGASSVANSGSEARMYSLFYFFPRVVLPALRLSSSKKEIIVTLPTREEIIFDARTKEILYGVLKETEPLDAFSFTERTFGKFIYTGTGMMLRADQEKLSPRFANVGEESKSSILQFGQQTCRIPNEQLWFQNATLANQSSGINNQHLFKFPSDVEFFKFVNTTCGWELNVNQFKNLDELN